MNDRCEKCNCPECDGTGTLGHFPCGECEEKRHTCIPNMTPKYRPPAYFIQPMTEKELEALEASYSRTGHPPYIVARLLATIGKMRQKILESGPSTVTPAAQNVNAVT